MKAIGQWILLNPSAFKAYLLVVIAWIGKGILAVTGKVHDLGQWSGFVDQGVDVIVGAMTIYGIGGGVIHTARGPLLTSVGQASTTVAALVPVAPVESVVEQVKSLADEIVAVVPPADIANPQVKKSRVL